MKIIEPKCDKCGEPELIPGCCYDHAKMCSCGEPMHFNDDKCEKCKSHNQANTLEPSHKTAQAK